MVTEKLIFFGGRHFSSVQAWYSMVPVKLVLILPFTFTFCLNTTRSEYCQASISSVLSRYFSSSPSSVTLSLISTRGFLLNTNAVGMAIASSGCFWEYRCQPSSMFAVSRTSYSLSLIFSAFQLQWMGSWAREVWESQIQQSMAIVNRIFLLQFRPGNLPGILKNIFRYKARVCHVGGSLSSAKSFLYTAIFQAKLLLGMVNHFLNQ